MEHRSRHSENRFIEIYGNGINYIYKTKNLIYHCTFFQILYDILRLDSVSPYINNSKKAQKDRLHFAQPCSSILKHFSMAELCAACYTGAITSLETWEQELRDFKDWLRDKDNSRGYLLNIEHADGNQTNCTFHNLSVMRQDLNREKDTITAQIKQPAILVSGYYDNEYRVRVCYHGRKCEDGNLGVQLLLRCDCAEDYVMCLKEIREIGIGYGAPIYGSQWLKSRPCPTKQNVGLSIEGQKELARIGRDYFVRYEQGIVCDLYQAVVKGSE